MRGLPVVGPDINVWANDLRRYLGRQLDRLSWRVAGQTASENGMILWDEEKKYPVVSLGGSWRKVVLDNTSGIAEIDFGASAKVSTVVVTGVSAISETSVVLVKMRIEDTADHIAEDLLIDPIRVEAFSIVAGTGFTIHGTMENAPANGKYNVQWALV